MYIDLEGLKIRESSAMDFKTRIIGLVSFFNEKSGIDEATGANIFPQKIEADSSQTSVEMSDYQFVLYCEARNKERELEERAARKSKVTEGIKFIKIPSVLIKLI